jgi:heat shock protein HslJ
MRFQVLILLAIMTLSCVEQVSNQPLHSDDWKVIAIENSTNIIEGTKLNLNIEEGRVSGNAGCNNFFGSIIVKDNNIEFNQLGATRKMCSDMTTEDLFFTNIEKVKFFKLQKETLHLQSENKSTLIKLEKIEATKQED